jgi:hypothetical protein
MNKDKTKAPPPEKAKEKKKKKSLVLGFIFSLFWQTPIAAMIYYLDGQNFNFDKVLALSLIAIPVVACLVHSNFRMLFLTPLAGILVILFCYVLGFVDPANVKLPAGLEEYLESPEPELEQESEFDNKDNHRRRKPKD